MTKENSKSFQECVKEYEAAVTVGNDCVAATVALLDGLVKACSRGGFMDKGVAESARDQWYTRAASALTRVITGLDTRITKTQLADLAHRKPIIVYIFSASGFRNMSHCVDMVTETSADGQVNIKGGRAAVLLTFIGIDDVSDLLMDAALSQSPDFLFYLLIGWLNQRAVLTAQGEKNRGRLLTSGHLLEAVNITDTEILPLSNTWMYSSYASEPKKHDLKVWLNRMLAKRLVKADIVPTPVSHEVKIRPKVMVIHERFTSQHAMFRCYAPLMKSLAPYCDTIAMAEDNMIDEASNDIFDKVIKLASPRPSIKDIMILIQEHAPDVIYYPSLGMSAYTLMLAGLRLAPLQIMTQGHPATSKLDTIDYVYINKLRGDPTLVHSERVITGPEDLAFASHSGLPDELPELLPPSTREVNIAVNSKVMKLSWRLLNICKRLQQEADVPIKFTFFPGERFLFGDGLDAAIQTHLPQATIVPYCSYDKFLQKMSRCDFALSSFPFGNTNSTVDTSLLGLPTVVHFGPESPAQTDALVLKSAGLPNWLICDNDEEYFQTALRLANEPLLRAEAMAGLDRAGIRERLFNNSKRLESEPFGEVVYKLHRYDAILRDSAERLFDYTEILAMGD